MESLKDRLNRVVLWTGFFGFDVFLSYKKSDASLYVKTLENTLKTKAYLGFLDISHIQPGDEFIPILESSLKRSSCLILVTTDKVSTSGDWVAWEIDRFAKREKHLIISIDVDHALSKIFARTYENPVDESLYDENPIKKAVFGLQVVEETKEALIKGCPSPHVIVRIEESFRFVRRQTRIKRFIGAAFVLCVLMLVVTTLFFYGRT